MNTSIDHGKRRRRGQGRDAAALVATAALAGPALAVPAASPPAWSIVVHGGAGVIARDVITPETEAAYRAAMNRALETGGGVLAAGGSALDAVEAVIRELEDDPLFNAGRGAVLTADGGVSLDASIMVGTDGAAGAVAGLSAARHPITAARRVMSESPHVFLAGEGADAFVVAQDLETVAPSYYVTQRRWESLLRRLDTLGLPHPPTPAGLDAAPPADDELGSDADKHGTVGVVARDAAGRIAAGTSTGGTTAKRWGRVGDSPVIGAGTWADGRCGVSATGTGEYFLRLAVARTICARVEFLGETPVSAAEVVIGRDLTALGGDGGVIVMGADSGPGWAFNTAGMYRAAWTAGGPKTVAIFGDEEG